MTPAGTAGSVAAVTAARATACTEMGGTKPAPSRGMDAKLFAGRKLRTFSRGTPVTTKQLCWTPGVEMVFRNINWSGFAQGILKTTPNTFQVELPCRQMDLVRHNALRICSSHTHTCSDVRSTPFVIYSPRGPYVHCT